MPSLNLDLNYREHPKTRRLVAMVGKEAEFAPVKLWLYAGKIHPETGKLKGYSALELESLADWTGTPGALIEAMEKVEWLKKDAAGNYALIGWKEHQGHLVSYKVRGKIAAKARWDKVLRTMPKACHEHAPSNAKTDLSNAPTNSTHGTELTERGINKGGEDFAVAPPPGFPENEDQAVFVGERSGVPRDRTLHFWNDLASKGWRDGSGVPICDFGRYCKTRFDNEQNKRGREAAKAASRPPSSIDIGNAIKAKEAIADAIRKKHTSEVATGTIWDDQAKRQEYFKLKKEAKELLQRQANLA